VNSQNLGGAADSPHPRHLKSGTNFIPVIHWQSSRFDLETNPATAATPNRQSINEKSAPQWVRFIQFL